MSRLSSERTRQNQICKALDPLALASTQYVGLERYGFMSQRKISNKQFGFIIKHEVRHRHAFLCKVKRTVLEIAVYLRVVATGKSANQLLHEGITPRGRYCGQALYSVTHV